MGSTNAALRAVRGYLLASALLSAGCLIEEPPDQVTPELTGPRPIEAYPTVYAPYLTNTGDPDPIFKVDFLVEDLGEPIKGVLFLNFSLGGDAVFLGQATSAAPVEGQEVRSVSVPWTQNESPTAGCYSVTMAISFTSNFSEDTFLPIDRSKTALVTWWIAHDIEPENISLDECFPPRPLGSEGDP